MAGGGLTTIRERRKKVAPAKGRVGSRPARAGGADRLERLLSGPRGWWVGVAVVVTAGALLRLYRLGEPIGGYFAFNEAYYMSLASMDAAKNALEAFFFTSDLNNRPLLTFLLSRLFSVFGPSLLAGRVLVVGFAALGGAGTALLSRELHGRDAGWEDAALLTFVPATVLVARNLQTDGPMLGLMAVAAWLYVRAARTEARHEAWLSGLCLGLAVLAKVPAALLIPVLAVWEWRAIGRAGKRELGRWARVLAAAAIVAAPWYAVQLAMRGAEYAAVSAELGGYAEAPTGAFVLRGFIGELSWALTPVVAALLLLGVATSSPRRDPAGAFVVAGLSAYSVFYLLLHKHTYYMLPLVLFAALAAAQAFRSYTRPLGAAARVAALAALVAALAFASFVTMSGVKYGAWTPATLEAVLPEGRLVAAAPDVLGTDGDAVALYVARERMVPIEGLTPTATAGTVLVLDQTTGAPPAVQLREEAVAPVVFGFAVIQRPVNRQLFRNDLWRPMRVGPPWWFGVWEQQVDARRALYPPGDYVPSP